MLGDRPFALHSKTLRATAYDGSKMRRPVIERGVVLTTPDNRLSVARLRAMLDFP
jgi:hypothetical protein